MWPQLEHCRLKRKVKIKKSSTNAGNFTKSFALCVKAPLQKETVWEMLTRTLKKFVFSFLITMTLGNNDTNNEFWWWHNAEQSIAMDYIGTQRQRLFYFSSAWNFFVVSPSLWFLLLSLAFLIFLFCTSWLSVFWLLQSCDSSHARALPWRNFSCMKQTQYLFFSILIGFFHQTAKLHGVNTPTIIVKQ